MPRTIWTTRRPQVSAFPNVFALVLCGLGCGDLAAYEVPLTPAALHEAFVLGQRNDQATADFLNPYLKQLTERVEVPHIAEIEVLTPFAQIVDRSRRRTSGYSEQQAARDYQRLGNTVRVRILLLLPAAYPRPEQGTPETNAPQPPPSSSSEQNSALRPEKFWQNFRFALKQHGKVIPTRSVQNKPVHSSPTPDEPAVLDGATVWLEYDANDVASDEATIEVVTPESKTITAVFDFKKLR